ncbi:MAG TPA: ribonuclease H-like domain-containing protein [Candidatus Paceibacterota bacterium]|jgi:DEAD/DEAH box helicase domain-containing protein|nr:ribonuclease H-like domain-containing protein [Candidatus Paceibacterota bacterium]
MKKIVFDIETRNTFQDVGSAESTALDISIVGVYDSSTDSYSTYTVEELPKLWPILENADLIIGYNSEHFDLPLLNKYYHGDLSRLKHVDILKEIKQSFGRRMKLDQVAEGTLGINKSGHGLDAIRWWRQGEIDKIRKYCLDDVRITKEVYEYALKNGGLKFKEGGQVMDIKLDTSGWETPEEGGMMLTLPF